MVTRYGMVEDLGYVAYEAQPPRFLDLPGFPSGGCSTSPRTQQRIDDAVRTIVMDAFQRSTALLERHRALLDRAARELLAHETLDEAALLRLSAELRASAPAVPAAPATPATPAEHPQ
jgi:cell division protease FtsH